MKYPFVGDILRELKRHDEECYGHSMRVWGLAHRFSSFLDWSLEARQNLILAAPIHDAGKLFVSHNILSKPGLLTDAEWATIRSHPALGAAYLSEFGVPDHLRAIVACHHERVDGHGYPSGRSEVPIEARALAICDTVDAMCSTRCYHPKCSIYDCLKELQACAGGQFDEDLVHLFAANWKEISKDMF